MISAVNGRKRALLTKSPLEWHNKRCTAQSTLCVGNKKGKTELKAMCDFNLFTLIPACTARPGLPLSPPETAFLESPYYRPQTASIADRHHPTNFHSVTYTQTDDAAFEAGSDNDHKSFLRMRVIFTVEYPAELFRFRRVLDDILSSFDVF